MTTMAERLAREMTLVINEKLKRCRDFKDGKEKDRDGKVTEIYINLCYKENSPKEELVLEHVIQFKRQFQLHYDEKRELFLYPKNECEVYKFICTTIRPQKIGYLEMYNYESASKYLSFFVQYEQLDPPDRFPQVIPSPSNIAKWQKGDCFDMSILLASLLIGVGYDAYCVYGLAPRSITQKNQSDLEYIFINKGVTVEKDVDQQQDQEQIDDEYAIKKKEEVVSKYDTMVKQKEEEKEKEQKRIALTIDDDEPDEMGPDPYAGRRIHCWVLIKAGKRNVEKHIFIEPSTGRIYQLSESPYLKVDAVFNHRNFWVNMKMESKVADVNFDEMDTSMNWEYVMLDTMTDQSQQDEEDYQYGEDNQNHQKQVDPDQQQLQDIAQLLDMPPPWAPKIQIDKEAFLRGTPLGESTTFFKKCKVDNYAPYGQPDGLVQKYTIYQDYKRLKIIEYRYFYMHRSDKLVVKRRFPFESKTIEEYEPGKPPHRKQIITINGRLRIITFYPNRNQDGLIKRIELIGEKTTEIYQNRDDKVIYRSVRFLPNYNQKTETKDLTYKDRYIGDVKIEKMTQKLEKREFMPANDQISKMIIDLKKNIVSVYYHMNEGEINPRVKEYKRDSMHGYAKLQETTGEKKNDEALIQQENTKISQLEKECHGGIKFQEASLENEESGLRSEPLILEKTLHDKAREKAKETQKKSEEEVTRDNVQKDYLYPYLEKLKWVGKQAFSYEEATKLKGNVMSKFKERLLERGGIIQKKLEEERAKLEEAEQALNKKADLDKNATSEIEQIQFRIDILEQRAARFEAQALNKYQEMDRKINEDKRFEALKRNK